MRIACSHWWRRTRVGTRHSVDSLVRAIAATAMRVFPLPVGKATIPRRPLSSQAWSAASWYGLSSIEDQTFGCAPGGRTVSEKETACRIRRVLMEA